MSVQHDSMIHPNVESLLGVESVEGSKFQLVTLASYRARQINSYFQNLGQSADKAVPPQVSTTARKPLSIAFEEIAAEKIVRVERLDEAELEADFAEAFGEEAPGDDVADDASGSIDE
ncbi:MAG: DNA-directed polymerase subunit omega [Actinomycetota bacterium]